MARQNRKTIRKNQEVKVVKGKSNLKSNSTKKLKKDVKKTTNDGIPSTKIKDDHTITFLNQKVKILTDISTIDGTLHKDEVVKVESIIGMGDKNLKVIDNVGRFWYVSSNDVSTKL